MGASQVPATSGLTDNFELISSVTASGSSVAFTSISGYKKLMLRCNALSVSGGNKTWTIRLNSDSGTNYDFAYSANDNVQTGQTAFGFPQTGELLSAFYVFENTNTTGVKTLEGSFKITNATPVSYVSVNEVGNYYASASISTVTLAVSTGNLSGTIALYGVRV